MSRAPLLTMLAILILTITLMILSRLRRRNSEHDDAFQIGASMATAAEADKRHRKRYGNAISPFAHIAYDKWKGEDDDFLDPIESPVDSKIQNLLCEFASASRKERKDVRARLSMNDFYTLLTFSSRMAIFAMRSGNTEQLRLGFTAISAIDAARIDPRDILIRLSLLNHSASRINADAGDLIKSTLPLASTEVTNIIKAFQRRPEAEKTLRKFGFEEVATQNGAGFISWRFGSYSPTINPLQMLVEIAAVLRSDRYAPSISLAVKPAPAWFPPVSAEEQQRRDGILENRHALSMVKGRLRPEHHNRADAQTFFVFLLECATEEDAVFLARLAVSRQTDASVALHYGRILCLITARSYLGNVESYETPESIQRFREPIEQVLKTLLGNP